MSKELEEIKCIVAVHFGALGFLNPIENEQILKDRDKVLNALTELQSIKEASPSEAMECLDRCYDQLVSESDNELEFKTIKHYILKAQEPKHYLKWEDLDFKEVSQLDHKIIKAKLNEQSYELDLYRYGGYKRVEIRAVGDSYNYNLGEGYIMCVDEEFPETIQFFNDLHLGVEE